MSGFGTLVNTVSVYCIQVKIVQYLDCIFIDCYKPENIISIIETLINNYIEMSRPLMN